MGQYVQKAAHIFVFWGPCHFRVRPPHRTHMAFLGKLAPPTIFSVHGSSLGFKLWDYFPATCHCEISPAPLSLGISYCPVPHARCYGTPAAPTAASSLAYLHRSRPPRLSCRAPASILLLPVSPSTVPARLGLQNEEWTKMVSILIVL